MNSSANTRDCLIELGMEELPPKAVTTLIAALAENLSDGLQQQRLSFERIDTFAAPRRLAVIVRSLVDGQPDESKVMRGPPVRIAFDESGEPTKAAEAFAAKAGVAVDALDREKTDKGEWLSATVHEKGVETVSLLTDILKRATDKLPIPRRMRWGDSDSGFIRPLHWLVVMFGEDIVPMTLFDQAASNTSRGHRFHAPGPVTIQHPDAYVDALRDAYVIADFSARREALWSSALAAANSIGCSIEEDDELIDEVTSLVDWPVAVVGNFESQYLDLPDEVLVSTLKKHQRYFPTYGDDGELRAHFITISNIESAAPDEVRRGNERVVAPRLSDAAFFWNNDQKQTLEERASRLESIVYQSALGSVSDKTTRVGKLAGQIAAEVSPDASDAVIRTATLMRADLLTDMVGEFPDLQGIMGSYYARLDGEADNVVSAIAEQYLPRFAGDAIPASVVGQIIAVADRLDTIAGIFAIGKRPSGNRDPFGLRRSALGLGRILIESKLDADLVQLIQNAVELQPVDLAEHPELADDIYDFIADRLRGYYQSSVTNGRPDVFEAVLARAPRSLPDFDQRIHAVADFVGNPAAETLAAINKRIANILKSAGVDAGGTLDVSALTDPEERALASSWETLAAGIEPMVEERRYVEALSALCELEAPVSQFFEHVMVMAEDADLRRNRLALLSEVRGLFLQIADISEIQQPGN
ncbi:MAG: glycine--tRNA ligase subunit beta [Pseudomonadota bacterium]